MPSYIICGIGIYYPYGFINSVGLLILMGVPGGIDYFVLTLVKIKVLPPRVEKDLNQSLNVWIRHPLACLSGLILIGGSLLHPEYFTSEYHRFFHGAAATRTGTILSASPSASSHVACLCIPQASRACTTSGTAASSATARLTRALAS